MYGIIILLRIMWNFDCSATIFCIIFKIASTQWLRFFFLALWTKILSSLKKTSTYEKTNRFSIETFSKLKSTLSVLLFTKITWTKHKLFLWWNQSVYFCNRFPSNQEKTREKKVKKTQKKKLKCKTSLTKRGRRWKDTRKTKKCQFGFKLTNSL